MSVIVIFLLTIVFYFYVANEFYKISRKFEKGDKHLVSRFSNNPSMLKFSMMAVRVGFLLFVILSIITVIRFLEFLLTANY